MLSLTLSAYLEIPYNISHSEFLCSAIEALLNCSGDHPPWVEEETQG